tara:strand:+ start:283 stop:540 length:258 start_codon:yes stop_codon:yes gene_type:complete
MVIHPVRSACSIPYWGQQQFLSNKFHISFLNTSLPRQALGADESSDCTYTFSAFIVANNTNHFVLLHPNGSATLDIRPVVSEKFK